MRWNKLITSDCVDIFSNVSLASSFAFLTIVHWLFPTKYIITFPVVYVDSLFMNKSTSFFKINCLLVLNQDCDLLEGYSDPNQSFDYVANVPWVLEVSAIIVGDFSWWLQHVGLMLHINIINEVL